MYLLNVLMSIYLSWWDSALSRMEMYLATIRVLDHGDSITRQQIKRKTGLNFDISKEFFRFLVHFDIIKEKTVGSKTVYNLTDKGQRLYTYFGLDDDTPYFVEPEYSESTNHKISQCYQYVV
jgi:predicted transcriptional regulator